MIERAIVIFPEFENVEMRNDAYKNVQAMTDRFVATVNTVYVEGIQNRGGSIVEVEHQTKCHLA